jgi:hypothetical protein
VSIGERERERERIIEQRLHGKQRNGRKFHTVGNVGGEEKNKRTKRERERERKRERSQKKSLNNLSHARTYHR